MNLSLPVQGVEFDARERQVCVQALWPWSFSPRLTFQRLRSALDRFLLGWLDWPDACRGDPVGDVCRSYLLLRLHADEVAEAYLDAYCRISCVTRQTILDWLPCVAAARLSEDVPGEQHRLLELVRSS